MDAPSDRLDPDVDFPVAFSDGEDRVVVNFGILTGREATQAELDRLAHALRDAGAAPEMTITAVRRQDYGERVEAISHQVHVAIPRDGGTQVEAVCRAWAVGCAAERHVEPLV
jgi:hypothetical protein